MTRANLIGADLSSALLGNTAFEAVLYSTTTRWPESFNPVRAGAIFVEPAIHQETQQLSPPAIKSILFPAKQSLGGTDDYGVWLEKTDPLLPTSFKLKPTFSLKVLPFFLVGLLLGQGYSVYRHWQNGLAPLQEVNPTVSSSQVVPIDEAGVEASYIEVFFGSHPSDERFDRAVKHYRSGEFERAIATLSSIPENSDDYDLAQVTIALWQREWEFDRRYMDRVQQEFQNQNWQAVVEAADTIFNDYWISMALPIADEARYQLALKALDLGDIQEVALRSSAISNEILKRHLLERIANHLGNDVGNLLETTPVSTY